MSGVAHGPLVTYTCIWGFAHTSNDWCTHDVGMAYVYFAFTVRSIYKLMVIKVRVLQDTSKISLRHFCI